jgi:Domain of unknown function (DUF4388)
MALTGQLNDLSLSELIEFFCNQRKTGRLKVDYALAPGVFFIKEGELVDAKIGALNGAEAVYFALTLPSAAFDFSAQVQSQRRTINEPWTRVVLEGLRRIDEGIAPSEQDPFAGLGNEELDEAIAGYLSNNEAAESAQGPHGKSEPQAPEAQQSAPLSLTVETANAAATGRRKFVFAGVAAAVVLACVVAGIPLVKHFSHSNAAVSAPAPAVAQPSATDNNASAPSASAPDASVAPAPDAVAADDAAQAAKQARERELRQQREREQQRKLDEAKKSEQQPLPSPSPAVGPKTVRVSVSYDENGHVTSASAVGSSPGAEAYASTAVRVARGRRFPAGQAGSTVVTIPIN